MEDKKEIKHTPSPWEFEEEPTGENTVTIEYRGVPLATVRGFDDVACCVEGEEGNVINQFKANAKLIAAAPELLEALKKVLNDFRTSKWSNETYNTIESAIKKATI